MKSLRNSGAPAAAVFLLVGCGGEVDLDADRPGADREAVGASLTTNAVYTTTNPDVDGTGHCQNGNEGVNCNLYDDKEFVWLSGGPLTGNAGLPDGTYFFAVLEPGGQGGNDNPNDGTEKNLSDLSPTTNTGAGDAWTNRIFTLAGGVLGYTGTHDFSENKIRLMPFDDTPNEGGVYILAVCSLTEKDDAFEYPVDPSDCKYDAFKKAMADLTVSVSDPLNFDATFSWAIDKTVDRTSVKQSAPTALFNYAVMVTHDSGTTSNWVLTGTVDIENPNGTDVIADVAVAVVPDSWTCFVDSPVTVPAAGTISVSYTCSYGGSGTPPASDVIATVSWMAGDEQHTVTASDPLDIAGAIGSFLDECAHVSDSYAGSLGTVCVGAPNPTVFTYSRTVEATPGTCTKADNTATFTTNDTGATGAASQDVTLCVGADLTVSKTADPSFTRTYAWDVEKDVDKTLVEQFGGSATFHYTVNAAQTGFSDSDWVVVGYVNVKNPNDWQDVTANIVDFAPGGVCTLVAPTVTVPALGEVFVEYECHFDSGDGGTNEATAVWDSEAYFTPASSASGSKDYAFVEPTDVDDATIHVDDSVAGALGSVTATDDEPFAQATFSYERTVPVPTWNCVTYDNTATITETGQSDSITVEVCGPHKSGAMTIGFWHNKNGQTIIIGQATSGVCPSTDWLRQFAPFQDLVATATCAQVGTYVTNVIKAASASGASMNAMLKAQMLATALDVYFSDPVLGGNKINAPGPLGGVSVDLTMVCTDLSCIAFEDSSAVFGGSPRTVLQMLDYAASQSNVGGSSWYDNVKATQELAKDAFDAINNEKVFAP